MNEYMFSEQRIQELGKRKNNLNTREVQDGTGIENPKEKTSRKKFS